jgi:hypothetical protein
LEDEEDEEAKDASWTGEPFLIKEDWGMTYPLVFIKKATKYN